MVRIILNPRKRREIKSAILLKERIKKIPQKTEYYSKYFSDIDIENLYKGENDWLRGLTTRDAVKLRERFIDRYGKRLNEEEEQRHKKEAKIQKFEKYYKNFKSNLEHKKELEELKNNASDYSWINWKKAKAENLILGGLESKEEKEYIKNLDSELHKTKEKYKELKQELRKVPINKKEKRDYFYRPNDYLKYLRKSMEEIEDKIEKRKKIKELKEKAYLAYNKNPKLLKRTIPDYFNSVGIKVENAPSDIEHLYHGIWPTADTLNYSFAGSVLSPEEYVKRIKKVLKEGLKPSQGREDHPFSDLELSGIYFLEKPSSYGPINIKINAKDIKEPLFVTGKENEIIDYTKNIKVPFTVFLRDPKSANYSQLKTEKRNDDAYQLIKEELQKEGIPFEEERQITSNTRTRKNLLEKIVTGFLIFGALSFITYLFELNQARIITANVIANNLVTNKFVFGSIILVLVLLVIFLINRFIRRK